MNLLPLLVLVKEHTKMMWVVNTTDQFPIPVDVPGHVVLTWFDRGGDVEIHVFHALRPFQLSDLT